MHFARLDSSDRHDAGMPQQRRSGRSSPVYARVEHVQADEIADVSLPPETQLSLEDGFKVGRTTCGRGSRIQSSAASSRSGGQGHFRGIPPELTELIVFVEGFGAKPTRPRLLDKCSSNRGLPVNWPLFLGLFATAATLVLLYEVDRGRLKIEFEAGTAIYLAHFVPGE